MVGRTSLVDFIIYMLAVGVFYYAGIWMIRTAVVDAEIRDGLDNGNIRLSQRTKDWLFLFPRGWSYRLAVKNRFSWYVVAGAVWTHIGMLIHTLLAVTAQVFDIKVPREVLKLCVAFMIMGMCFSLFVCFSRFVLRELICLIENIIHHFLKK